MRRQGNIKIAANRMWESCRYLTSSDGFGFSFHHTILRNGESTLINNKNHLGGVLMTSGTGTIELSDKEDQGEGEGFVLLKVEVGMFMDWEDRRNTI